jgi:hypothetical protein
MALQTSGAISLNDIQTEFGGSNPISISEYYGAAAGIPASGVISIGDFYGASAVTYLDYQTVTVGFAPGGQYTPAVYGYSTFSSIGSISDGTSDLYGGATIIELYQSDFNALYFEVSGNQSNSGWSTMTVSGQTFNRADASYSYSSGSNQTGWFWNTSASLFTPTGANIGVEFN